ncbi:MAG: biotin/lipoyl-binding protein [Alphaproteobacteria bacterium]|nr:biotin/lipoyl-binding protein [Alphaproteobacteria bacterium]
MTPLARPFKSVLVANRGEIAVRIVREAKAACLRSIAVYSDADKNALHVQDADAAVHIGASPARESYLNGEKIIAAAKQTNAEAIHPGYGFLSENADFAQTVIDAGLVWIGPSPDAIRAMGDKGAAKQIARKADVPVIPGYDGDDQSDERLLAEAKKIGWPVLIKAANGGGGRGQRRVTSEGHFADALASARRESLSAFASDKVILERALDHVRHVEVQVFGDVHGNIIHLGERDCSVQRRNQKLIEEAPAPGVGEELRARMGDAAVRLARAVNYTNAGTVEFLLDRDGKFYFLEMNTRIQVEHPVTEEVVHANLIQMQFDVAMGMPVVLRGSGFRFEKAVVYGTLKEGAALPPNTKISGPQDQVTWSGHAIEARLCAEDPADNFAPQVGPIEEIYWGGDVRADGVEADGNPASGHYDSLLVKMIARGETRDEARLKLISGLEKAQVVGIRTNRNFLIDVLKREAVLKGAVDIRWVEREPGYTDDNLSTPLAAIAGLRLARADSTNGWRSTGTSRAIVILRERTKTRTLVVENGKLDGLQIAASESNNAGRLRIESDGIADDAWVNCSVNRIHVHFRGRDALFEDITYAPAEPKDSAGDGAVRAPMAGKIVRVNIEPGAKVKKGKVLVILEAMKMEHEITARISGTVASVAVKPGDQATNRQILATIAAS